MNVIDSHCPFELFLYLIEVLQKRIRWIITPYSQNIEISFTVKHNATDLHSHPMKFEYLTTFNLLVAYTSKKI